MIDNGAGHSAEVGAAGAAGPSGRAGRAANAGGGSHAPTTVAGEVMLDAILAQVEQGEAGRFAIGQASAALRQVILWLGQEGPRLAPLSASWGSVASKGALIDRIYGCLIDTLPDQLRYRARLFVDGYMATERDVVHGTLCARHVREGGWPIAAAGSQGHLGEATFDLGCLVSDYAVAFIRCGRTTVPLFELAFAQYRHLRTGMDAQAYARYRAHLALHLLRRLYGFEIGPCPLGRKDIARARIGCLDALVQWLP